MSAARTKPYHDRWEIWTHKEPRETTYPILYWAIMADEIEQTDEVRRIETNSEGMILPAERMVKGPRLPLEGFLDYYKPATAYA